MRHFSDARPAPGSPAVDDDSFAGKGPYELGHKVGSFNIRRFKKTGAKWGFDQRFSKTVAGGAAGSLGKGSLSQGGVYFIHPERTSSKVNMQNSFMEKVVSFKINRNN
jgi:hypothetical protein